MKKTLKVCLAALLLQAAGAGFQATASPSVTATANDPAETVTVHIELVNPQTGNPVTSHGLQGYWAKDQATGVYYYSDYSDNFEELPEGTYMFGAFNGYWDGASSRIVTLDAANGNYTVVTLNYWSE